MRIILDFFKKTYKVLIVLFLTLAFFSFYNIYLIDHSLVNLKFALNNLAQAQTLEDFEKIRPLLKAPLLKEIAKPVISPSDVFSLESADNIISQAKNIDQVEDARFLLKSVIHKKEQERRGILSFFDRLNAYFSSPSTGASKQSIEVRIKAELRKIVSGADKKTLQEIYYKIGNLYLELPNLEESVAYFNKAISVYPESGLAKKAEFNLAWAYKNAGDYEKASLILRDFTPFSTQVKLAASKEYETADILYKEGRYTEARDRYAQLARENPDFESSALALFNAGTISLYQLNDFRSSLGFLYEFALSSAGNVSYYELRDLDAALQYFSQLEARLLETDRALKDAMSEEKLKVINKTRDVMAREFRQSGYRLLKERMYAGAIKNFSKAVEISPKDGYSLVGRGLAYYWLGQKEEALEEVRRAIRVSPGEEFVSVNALFIFINSSNLEEAIKEGEAVIGRRKLAVRAPELYYNLGYAYVLSGKFPEATLYFDRAIRLNSDFAFAYNNLGCAFWSLKNYAQAIKKFKEAIDRNPAYADAYFNLGVAYSQLNRFDEAYRQFEQVLDINPNYKEAVIYLQRIKITLKYQP